MVGLSGANPLVQSYSDWTVTLDWKSQVTGAPELQATLGQGLPYAYFTTPSGGQVQITTQTPGAPGKLVKVDALDSSGNVAKSGTGPLSMTVTYTLQVATPNPLQLVPAPADETITITRAYGIFLPNDVTWSLSAGPNPTLTTSALPKNGFFSVATLPTLPNGMPDTLPATFNFFRQHAYNMVTGSSASFTYDPNSSTITTTYTLQTADPKGTPPLMALYPFQVQSLQGLPANGTDPRFLYQYSSPRGTLQVMEASSFSTQMTYNGILPFLPPITGNASGSSTYYRDLWRNQLYPYLVSVSTQQTYDGSLSLDKLIDTQAVYSTGQALMGAMQLVPLLQQVSQSSQLSPDEQALAAQLARQVVARVENVLGAWLSAQDDQALQLLYYQPNTPKEANAPAGAQGWNALLGEAPQYLSSESINDQNLGFGYYVKTAALLSMYDPSWSDQAKFGQMMNLIVGEVANYNRQGQISPATLTRFPFLRNFDVYAGQSFADGSGNNALGTNQESSSESLNFASGLILWGQVSGQTSLRDLGIYLYTTESNSVFLNYFNPAAAGTPPGPAGPTQPSSLTRGLLSDTQHGGSTTQTYNLGMVNVPSAGGGSGYIFLGSGAGSQAIQTFTVASDGTMTFADVGTQAVKATAGQVNFATGTVTLTWNADPGNSFVALIPSSLLRPLTDIVFNAGGQITTFFGLETTKLLGIEVLPLSASSYYLSGLSSDLAADAALVNANVAAALVQPAQPGMVPIEPPQYLSTVYAYEAFADPSKAINDYLTALNKNQLALYNPNGSDVHAYNIDFIRVLQEDGQVDPSVTANVPDYVVFKKGSTRTYVAYNPDPGQAKTVVFKDASGNTLFTMVVPPLTEMSQSDGGGAPLSTTPVDYSLQTPNNRFFFHAVPTQSGALPQNGTLVRGQGGKGEYAAVVPTTGKQVTTPPTDANLLSTFTATGLNGTLNPTLTTTFHVWVDPGWVTAGQGAPSIGIEVSYDPDGTADPKKVVTLVYTTKGLSIAVPGYVDLASNQLQLVSGNPAMLPQTLTNGIIKVSFWAAAGTTPINVRTDAALEQGRVSYLDIPYTFTSAQLASIQTPPEQPPQNLPVAAPPAQPTAGLGHTYTASLSGSSAIFTGDSASDTLVFDATGGLLRHNRFTAGDPGFVSDLDFDSTAPGEQQLAAAATSSVTVFTGGGADVVRLGTSTAPASSLLANFTIDNNGSDGQPVQLIIDDSASLVASQVVISAGHIVVTPLNGGTPTIDVTLTGNVLGGGITFISGQATDRISVQSTRAGEPLLLDSGNGLDTVTIGDQGSTQGILGDVTVQNTPLYTDLVVDNSAAANASGTVTIGTSAITGLAPATIHFRSTDIGSIDVLGGTGAAAYQVTGSIDANPLSLTTGTGDASVTVSNNGVVSDALFPGHMFFQAGTGTGTISFDNSAGAGADVALTPQGLAGLTNNEIQFGGFARAIVSLNGNNTVIVNGTVFGTATTVNTGNGTNVVQVTGTIDPVTVNGGSGNNTLNVDATGSGAPAVVTQPGRVVGDHVSVNYSGARTINLNNALAVNTTAGPNTRDRDAAFIGLNPQERFVQALYLASLGRAGSMAELDGWLGTLNSPGGQQAVATAVEGSAEAQEHLVQTWYLTYLGRQVQGGEEIGWVAQLQSGQSEEQVLAQILGSQEFFNHAQTGRSGGTANQNYVKALYQLLLGRSASDSELAGWVSALPGLGAQGVALAVLQSQEGRTDLFEGYYNALLHRPASAAEVDGWRSSRLDAHTARVLFESGSEFFSNG
jgi:hypothetical protein